MYHRAEAKSKSKAEEKLGQLGKEKVKAPFNRHEYEETVHRY